MKTKMNRIKQSFIIILGAILLLCAACKKTDAPEELVVCTTYPVRLLTLELMAGAENPPEIALLVPPGTGCPHHFSLPTREKLRIASAKKVLLLRNGGGVDDSILHAAKNADPDLTDGNGGADFSVHADPHYFSAPGTAAQMIRNLAEHLKKFDPANGKIYEDNAERLTAELAELSRLSRNIKKVKVVAMHNTLANLAAECGLDLRAVVFPGHVSELPPAELNRLIRLIREEQISYLLTEPQTPERFVKLLQQETGIRVILLDPVATGPADAARGYLTGKMRHNLKILERELQ